jgi:[protein-PII] uridylyltransferase
MTRAERHRRTTDADALCAAAFASAMDGGDATGLALVAVGGYGRRELAPHSDLDVVLVHDDRAPADDVRRVAGGVWYPLWDAGTGLDHAVRAVSEATAAARADPRVALGLLDARHVAGDPVLTLRLRAELLAQWRREARERLPAVRRLVTARTDRRGELAHAAVPDLKESVGGLRDATVLKALVATWLVDVPHADLERSRLLLLDVRDVLQAVTGRATDRVAPELWSDVAAGLGLAGAEQAQRHVRELGRRIAHLSRLTWRRVDAVPARPARSTSGHRRTPGLERVAAGVAVSGAEVVLDRGAEPTRDPLLLLRAAAEAAERGLALAPATASRLARDAAPVPQPWSGAARDLLTRLLASGPGLVDVWETLDETGALDRLLPEWRRVRLLPHASPIHRFTVDRHLVETCVEAARLIRRVTRVDVLMVAALLHDLGKSDHAGHTDHVDHALAGEPMAGAAAERMGFDDRGTTLVRLLVRRHLLLAQVATTRDLADPATVRLVTELIPDVECLELLAALTEADARAASPKAWTAWRASLVADLVRRVRAALAAGPAAADAAPSLHRHPDPAAGPPGLVPLPLPGHAVGVAARGARVVDVRLEETEGGTTVTVVADDRVGLMADVSGALVLLHASVRSARAWVEGDLAVSRWEVDDPHLDEAMVRQRVEAVTEGRVDPSARVRAARRALPEPVVRVCPGASQEATVIEVRVDDRPGVVHLVCAALARLDLSVRSAHVATAGPQAVDVFYVQDRRADPLGDERAATAVHAVRRVLRPAATLDADRG